MKQATFKNRGQDRVINFVNSGQVEFNDVIYDELFDLEKNEFSFAIHPNTDYWRFGLRISPSNTVEFHEGMRHVKGNHIDIQVAVGKWFRPQNRWENGNIIELGKYDQEAVHEVIDTFEKYEKRTEVRFSIGKYESNILSIVYETGSYKASQNIPISINFRYFKVFAWADMIAFNLDCTIHIPQLSSSRFDQVINTIVDGNEEQRSDLLLQIQSSTSIDRLALSSRLRFEIQFRFNSLREKDFATAIRDPKKISSIRSWMLSCLIWTDAEYFPNSQLLRDHIHSFAEPDESVRYWTLAGLYQKKVSYLQDALNTVDSTDDSVGLLSEAIRFASNEEVIQKFRTALYSTQFETSWKILRILRIVPILELVPDVCQLLIQENNIEPLPYDAFYALTHPAMIREAVTILEKKPGVKQFVKRLVSIVSGSNVNTIRNFAPMLLAFKAEEIDSSLEDARNDSQTHDTALKIISALNHLRQTDESQSHYIAGYRPDTINITDDRLDIQQDVRILTSVILAKEVLPPLAIGLFGNWGTGKTFFIRSMQAEMNRIQKNYEHNSKSRFCTNIVQIDFNAWHYIDTNLWASLVSSIFEKLAAHVSPKESPDEQQATFLAELGSTKAIITEAETEKTQALQLIEEKQLDLQKLQAKREEKKITLKDLQKTDIAGLLSPDERRI